MPCEGADGHAARRRAAPAALRHEGGAGPLGPCTHEEPRGVPRRSARCMTGRRWDQEASPPGCDVTTSAEAVERALGPKPGLRPIKASVGGVVAASHVARRRVAEPVADRHRPKEPQVVQRRPETVRPARRHPAREGRMPEAGSLGPSIDHGVQVVARHPLDQLAQGRPVGRRVAACVGPRGHGPLSRPDPLGRRDVRRRRLRGGRGGRHRREPENPHPRLIETADSGSSSSKQR